MVRHSIVLLSEWLCYGGVFHKLVWCFFVMEWNYNCCHSLSRRPLHPFFWDWWSLKNLSWVPGSFCQTEWRTLLSTLRFFAQFVFLRVGSESLCIDLNHLCALDWALLVLVPFVLALLGLTPTLTPKTLWPCRHFDPNESLTLPTVWPTDTLTPQTLWPYRHFDPKP